MTSPIPALPTYPHRKEVINPVNVTVPVVALVAVLVVFAWWTGRMRLWHAALCLLCGFLLAGTGFAPGIDHGLSALLNWLTAR